MRHRDRRTSEFRAEAGRRSFAAGQRAETRYAQMLRGVARAVGHIVDVHEAGRESELERMLRGYAEILRPWARITATRMLQDVMRRDRSAWQSLGKQMGRALHREIETTPLGDTLRAALDRQVNLITSLPLDAARRVHEIATGTLYSGARAVELRDEILRSGHVTKSRAELIARTETSRVSTALTQARAEHVGSEGYIWRTAEDADVRELHRKLAGRFIRWDSPPVAGEDGERAHAGEIYNCRCYCDVVLPDEADARKAA